jgi:HEAT repeat protein
VGELYNELVAAAHDEYTNVALKAIQILAERDGENQKELFVELMESQHPLLRIAGAAAYLGSDDGP